MNRFRLAPALALPLFLAGCGSGDKSGGADEATQQVYYNIAAQLRAQNAKILTLEIKVDDLKARLDAQERTTAEILGTTKL